MYQLTIDILLDDPHMPLRQTLVSAWSPTRQEIYDKMLEDIKMLEAEGWDIVSAKMERKR